MIKRKLIETLREKSGFVSLEKDQTEFTIKGVKYCVAPFEINAERYKAFIELIPSVLFGSEYLGLIGKFSDIVSLIENNKKSSELLVAHIYNIAFSVIGNYLPSKIDKTVKDKILQDKINNLYDCGSYIIFREDEKLSELNMRIHNEKIEVFKKYLRTSDFFLLLANATPFYPIILQTYLRNQKQANQKK